MCEYCEEDAKPLYNEWDEIVYMENNLMWFKNADIVRLEIYYCPMCGKKLSEQEVEPCQTQPE